MVEPYAPADFTVSAERLLGALNAVKHAVARQEARPILNTFALEVRPAAPADPDAEWLNQGRLRVIAADNYRLAVQGLDLEAGAAADTTVLLPLAKFPMVRSFLHHYRARAVRVTSEDDGHEIFVRFATLRIGTRTEADILQVRGLDGRYPDYGFLEDQVVASTGPTVTLDGRYLPLWSEAEGKAIGPVVIKVGAEGVPLLVTRDRYREYIMPLKTATDLSGGKP